MFEFSDFGKRISASSGIGRLMHDLGSALGEQQDIHMLGGGNPAHIPQVQERFRKSMLDLLSSPGKFEKVIGDYDPPQGNTEFIK
jgi:valine--pyruvate aminotransferase